MHSDLLSEGYNALGLKFKVDIKDIEISMYLTWLEFYSITVS